MFNQNTCIGKKLKISKLNFIGHVLFETWTPQVYPKIRSKCKIRCESYFEMEKLQFDHELEVDFNSEQLYG